MFDIAFSELMLIALVALVVIGPERLPRVARTAGHLFGRLQRYVGDVKADIDREMRLAELKKLQEQVAGHAREMEQSVSAQFASVENSLNQSIAGPEAEVVSPAPAEPLPDTTTPPPAAESK